MVSKPKMFLFLQLLILSLTYAIQSKMKINQLFRLSIFSLLSFMIACNSEDTVTALSTDAQITSFSLTANDTVIKKLDQVFFTIDQLNEEIYNADSLPVGTDFTKLLAQISFNSASKAIIRYSSGDTLNYSSTDPIDFSVPFKIEVVAYDGVTTKTYNVKLNAHLQEPDSMQWNMLKYPMWDFDFSKNKSVQFNDKFYTYFETPSSYKLFSSSTSDGNNWNSEDLNGFPEDALIYTITKFNNKLFLTTSGNLLYTSTDGKNWTLLTGQLGFITPVGVVRDNIGIEHLIVEKVTGNDYYLAHSIDGTTYTEYTENGSKVILPSDFPQREFATITTPGSKSNKLSILGGIATNLNNAVLSSVHQMYWDRYGLHIAYNLNNNSGFANRKGAMAYYYDDRMMVGGGNANDTIYNDLFTSIDNGISWQRQDSLINFPMDFIPRANASTYVDSNNFVWVFGGIGEGGIALKEVWKGKINRLGFLNK